MTTEFSQRQPPGIPIGGQFAAATHAESPVRLFDRGDGTFLRPSPSATAEHCIEFWSRIEVPDVVIDQVCQEYAAFRRKEIDDRFEEEMVSWSVAWKSENPSPKREGRELDRLQARYTEEFNAYKESIRGRIHNEHVNGIGTYDARQLVRAAQMRRHKPNEVKFPEEAAKVLDHRIELFDETLTVDQIEEKYRLSRVAHAMQSIFPPKTSEDTARALETLDLIHTNLVNQRNDGMF